MIKILSKSSLLRATIGFPLVLILALGIVAITPYFRPGEEVNPDLGKITSPPIESLPEETHDLVDHPVETFVRDTSLADRAPPLTMSGEDNWTIMIYMDGDNNLEDAAIGDMNELESIDLSSLGVNIFVLMDRAEGFDTSNGDWTGTRLYEVTPEANPSSTIVSTQLADWGEMNMGNGSTLVRFVNWTLHNHPANNTALILWDHGGGIDGVCFDDASGHDGLTVSEIASALRRAKDTLETHGDDASIDILGFDACLMASIEVAYELREFASYMVASEEYEPGNGWPYDLILQDLLAQPAITPEGLAAIIVKRYDESYQGINQDVTQSALRLGKISDLANKIDDLVKDASWVLGNDPVGGDYNDTRAMESSRENAQNYMRASFVDLYHFVSLLKTNALNTTLINKCDEILSFWDSVVVAEEHGSKRPDSHGLTINFPTTDETYKQALQFKNFAWDDFVADYQSAVSDSAYQAWLAGKPAPETTGVDIACWWDYSSTPDVNTNITITWYVVNNGTTDARNIVIMVYESSRYSKEDAALVGYYELANLSAGWYAYSDMEWNMTTAGYRTISLYAWTADDSSGGNNFYSDDIWVAPADASVRGYIWLNYTDEGFPYMGYSNSIYYEVQNLGSGAVPQWFGNFTLWAYSYELDTYYLEVNTSFEIEAWALGPPPSFNGSISWNPSWGGWWDLILITSFENDTYTGDDFYVITVWVIDADCDLEPKIWDFDYSIEGLAGNVEIVVYNYGLTAPGVNGSVALWAWSIFEGEWNSTYDWELVDFEFLTTLDNWESPTDWYEVLTLSWTPRTGGYWILVAVAYEDYDDPDNDNDWVTSNDEYWITTWVDSWNPDIVIWGDILDDYSYQVGEEGWIYLELLNFGWTDSDVGDTEIYVWDYAIETDTITLIFSGYNGETIPYQDYIWDWLDWTPLEAGEHLLIFYAEDVPYEPYEVIDDYNWDYVYVTVEEAPQGSDDVSLSLWESSDDFVVSLYSTDIGDVDGDGVLEIVIVGNLTELSTGLEFFGLWIFYYNSTLDQLVLEYETYWSTGSDETLSAVLVEDLDGDLIPEITIAGFYYNDTDSSWYSWLAVCIYEELDVDIGYLAVVEYETFQNVWLQTIEIGQLDDDTLPELCIVGYYWEWNATAFDWDLYGFLSIVSYDYMLGELTVKYEEWWPHEEDFYLEDVALADMSYPTPDDIDEIVMAGYFYDYDTDTWYAYTAVYSYDYTPGSEDLILIDYEAVADTWILAVGIANVDQFVGNEIVVTGYYSNATDEEYIFLDIYYYEDAAQDLILQDSFYFSLGEDEVISSIQLIDVDYDGKKDVVVAGWYWNDTAGNWYSFIGVYNYTYGEQDFDGTMNLVFWLTWAYSNDRINGVQAENLDDDADIEVVTCGTAGTYGQAGVVTIQAGDEIAPTINEPSDITYEEGATGKIITWIPNEDNPATYIIYLDGTVNESGSWDGSFISINVDGLAPGSHNYTLVVFDVAGNLISDTVIITVVSATSPTIDHPGDITYEQNTIGHTITWQPNDAYPHNYTIYRNGFVNESGSWDGSSISINVDGLAPGTHNYTLVVCDEAGNLISDTVIITVGSATSPTIDHPDDITYEQNTIGHTITWQPSDAYPHNYTIYHDGTVKESGNWDGSSISINVDGLAPGTHNYTIVVCDEAGHRTNDTVMVIVTVPSATTTTTTTTTTEEDGGKDTPGFTLGILFVFGLVLLVTRSIHRRDQKR